jgi:PTS system nitrogen regulatory IIA component
MRLLSFISHERIRILHGRTKRQVLMEMVELLQSTGAVSKEDGLSHLIFQREASMSTGLEFGVAVPHTRIEGLTNPVVAVGTAPHGIPDYETIDGSEVTILLMIVTPTGNPAIYSTLLAQAVGILRIDEAREELLAASTPAEIYGILAARAGGGSQA